MNMVNLRNRRWRRKLSNLLWDIGGMFVRVMAWICTLLVFWLTFSGVNGFMQGWIPGLPGLIVSFIVAGVLLTFTAVSVLLDDDDDDDEADAPA